jgi:hypothetical protein
MPRRLIAYTPNGIRTLRNVYTDETGEPLVFVDEGETKTVTIDMTAYLDTGETISSVTHTDQLVTADVTLTSPTMAIELTGTTSHHDGLTTLTITLSSGEVMVQTIRVRRPNRFGTETYVRDYT